MIDDISPNIEVVNSYVFPFSFVFDKEKDELIRSYYPGDDISYIEMRNNFSQTAISELRGRNQEVHIERIDKLKDTNIWNAETYYGIEIYE